VNNQGTAFGYQDFGFLKSSSALIVPYPAMRFLALFLVSACVAANPFGAKEFTKGKTVLNFTIKAGKSETFRFRILIHSGKLTAEQTEAQYQQFLKDVQ